MLETKMKGLDMDIMSATALRKDLYNAMTRVNDGGKPVVITNSRGKGAVLVGEDDWAAIEETLFLGSIPGMSKSLAEGRTEPIEECISAEDLEW